MCESSELLLLLYVLKGEMNAYLRIIFDMFNSIILFSVMTHQ